jgi:hypothetical protein
MGDFAFQEKAFKIAERTWVMVGRFRVRKVNFVLLQQMICNGEVF